MEHFTHYILCKMTAEKFINLLRHVNISEDERARLTRILTEAEEDMIYEHVMHPNSD